jgi:hypothetical protein
MRLNSKYFDRIRVKPDEERRARERHPRCEHPGCDRAGGFRAPKGRDREGEYHNFCLDHVRAYNKAYNYFSGMDNDTFGDYLKDQATGHRPTWRLGETSWATHNGGRSRQAGGFRHNAEYIDPMGFLGPDAAAGASPPPRRALRGPEITALHCLGLEESATPQQIKAQYKKLVKRLHPDANNGSRDNEDKLREIIQAYDRLRSAGLC